MRRQLMHEYVQKSIRTTFPRSLSSVSGCELNQSPPGTSSGATWASTGSVEAPGPGSALGVASVVVSPAAARPPSAREGSEAEAQDGDQGRGHQGARANHSVEGSQPSLMRD